MAKVTEEHLADFSDAISERIEALADRIENCSIRHEDSNYEIRSLNQRRKLTKRAFYRVGIVVTILAGLFCVVGAAAGFAAYSHASEDHERIEQIISFLRQRSQ